MDIRQLIKTWFDKWSTGDFHNLPVTEDFRHTSPFGTIEGREAYVALVEANREKFLGHRFEIHDVLYTDDKACVRYTAIQGDFSLDVSEWYYTGVDGIAEIIAHYHIGEIREDRQLKDA